MTERLGIAHQHDGERAGRELPQYCRIKVGESEVKQAGREVADHAYTGGLSLEKAVAVWKLTLTALLHTATA